MFMVLTTGALAVAGLVGLIPWIVDATCVVLSAMVVCPLKAPVVGSKPGSLPEVKLSETKLMFLGSVEVSSVSSPTSRVQVPPIWAAVKPARFPRSWASSGRKWPT